MSLLRLKPHAALKRSVATIASRQPTKIAASAAEQFQTPPVGVNAAYDQAVKVLEKHREVLKAQIEDLKVKQGSSDAKATAHLDKLIVSKETELEYTFPENHWQFYNNRYDINKDIFRSLHAKRYKSYVIPRLLRQSEALGIVGDALVAPLSPPIYLEVNFPSTKWFGAYGHPIPPNWALYSPEVTITVPDDSEGFYTLMMVDLDRVNVESGTFEEWCHWLVTDIPVKSRLVIPGGSSPFLGPPTDDTRVAIESAKNNMATHPTAPETPVTIPGNVIFDYVPLHPPHQNPARHSRYFIGAYRQPQGQGQIDVAALKKSIQEKIASADATETRGTFEQMYIGEAEKKIQTQERAAVTPSWGFAKTHGLELQGYGFFTSMWNLYTPDIFTRLGIHEPVYGELPKNPKQFIKQVQTASEMFAKLPGPLTTLEVSELQHINKGTKATPHKPRVTMKTLEVEKLKQDDQAQLRARAQKIAEKEKSSVDDVLKTIAAKEAEWQQSAKLPRLTTIGAVSVVKNKVNDVATADGEKTAQAKTRRYKYLNV